MSQLNDFVSSHLGAIGVVIFVGCVVVLLLILMLFIQSRRIALLSERLDYLTRGADGQDLEGVLASHIETVIRVGHDLDELAARTAVLEGGARMHFGRLGLVRFNPFEDTGGNQSFALAILDANNDGFVMSSLHSRTGTRVYSKAIFGGECETLLGAEEAQAVEIAASQGGGLPKPRSAAARGAAGRGSGRGKAAGSQAVGAAATAKPIRPARTVTPATAASDKGATGEGPDAEAESTAAEPEPAELGSATPPV